MFWASPQLRSVLGLEASPALPLEDEITRGDPRQILNKCEKPFRDLWKLLAAWLRMEKVLLPSLFLLSLTFTLSFLSSHFLSDYAPPPPISPPPLPDSKICSCAHLNQSNKGCRFRLFTSVWYVFYSHLLTLPSSHGKKFVLPTFPVKPTPHKKKRKKERKSSWLSNVEAGNFHSINTHTPAHTVLFFLLGSRVLKQSWV